VVENILFERRTYFKGSRGRPVSMDVCDRAQRPAEAFPKILISFRKKENEKRGMNPKPPVIA
jgi:hypothetical protein